jgi:hypothetical protein
VASVPDVTPNGVASWRTGATIPVIDVGTEVRVVTTGPRGGAIAVVIVLIGWTAGARLCNAGAGSCKSAATGRGAWPARVVPVVPVEPVGPVEPVEPVALFDAGAALEGATTLATSVVADCAVSDTRLMAEVPTEGLDAGGAAAPAGWAKRADTARTARNAPMRPSASAREPGHQRDRTGSSAWTVWTCPTVVPHFAP